MRIASAVHPSPLRFALQSVSAFQHLQSGDQGERDSARRPHPRPCLQSSDLLPALVTPLVSLPRDNRQPTHTFLRARELSLYESHACQRSEEAATAQVEETLAIAGRIFSDLALPYLEVKRPSWDAAPGSWYTVAIDVIMPGGRTLQGEPWRPPRVPPAPSILSQRPDPPPPSPLSLSLRLLTPRAAASCHHYLDHWAKSFGIRFESEEGGRAHVHQTAFAMSERVLGCVIAIHGDDRGAIFPPKVAPIQVIVVPIVVNTGKAAGTRDRVCAEAKVRHAFLSLCPSVSPSPSSLLVDATHRNTENVHF